MKDVIVYIVIIVNSGCRPNYQGRPGVRAAKFKKSAGNASTWYSSCALYTSADVVYYFCLTWQTWTHQSGHSDAWEQRPRAGKGSYKVRVSYSQYENQQEWWRDLKFWMVYQHSFLVTVMTWSTALELVHKNLRAATCGTWTVYGEPNRTKRMDQQSNLFPYANGIFHGIESLRCLKKIHTVPQFPTISLICHAAIMKIIQGVDAGTKASLLSTGLKLEICFW